MRVAETPEQKRARNKYNLWRNILRDTPTQHDLQNIQRLWDGALEILNGSDRDTKQYIPKALDDEEFKGRQYIEVLMATRAQPYQRDIFISTCRAFLLVVTHTAIVDCLAVDIFVGSLYYCISGSGGRAIPFLQHLCEVLGELLTSEIGLHSTEQLDSTLIAITTVLGELLKREARVRSHQDLPVLVTSLDNVAHLVADVGSSYTAHILVQRVKYLQAVIARANGVVANLTSTLANLSLASGSTSTYPQRMIMPQDRHDNDKTDITEVTIFPTPDEITSDTQEFLPSTHPREWHYLNNKIERHIDTHFRLFRHDTFGALKSTLANIMEYVAKNPMQLTNPKLNFGDTRAYVYIDAIVDSVTFGSRQGLQANVSFQQPPSIRNEPVEVQLHWWKESKRLADGVLMSLIWIGAGEVRHMFFTVTNQQTNAKTERESDRDEHRKPIIVKLATQDQSTVNAVVDLSCYKTRGILLEFPNIMPSTFVPVLENLQNMQRLGRLPFSQWIIPDRSAEAYLDIPPPLYARKPGFNFSLQSVLLNEDNVAPNIDPTVPSSDQLLVEMEEKTGLDRGQCRAMVAALTREFAFIQGPPGTGKSYLGIQLMKVLLDAKQKADLGPIVVVCYTNHALDQFLEHLITSGMKKVIRIGGRSRSQLLEDHNLRIVTQSETKTKSEGRQIGEAYKDLEVYEAVIKDMLSHLRLMSTQMKWHVFNDHLRDQYAAIHAQFQQIDNDGFTAVGPHPFTIWIKDLFDGACTMTHQPKASPMELASIKQRAAVNVNLLSARERYLLIQFWIEELRGDAKAQFFETLSDVTAIHKHLRNVHEEVRRRVLQDADVVGLTTTGLANNIATLQRVRCKVVICEEAGEVMEAHMLSAMLPTVEHCIQIGDHEQLRPTINDYDMSLENPRGRLFQLDRSQFERLCIEEPGWARVPTVQLNVQRRMRPEISTLIRETVYAKLVDHPSTSEREDVVGMRQNVFWLDHDYVEDQKQAEVHGTKSKSNKWEVKMTHALVRHLIRQGAYKSTDIAVLTPYTGQLQRLRAAMRADFEIVLSDRDQDALVRDGLDTEDKTQTVDDSVTEQRNRRRPLEMKKITDLLRVATVDNFQGEEAKVVIVSLVRSNQDNKVGFLRTTNRINVLLSRARNGMFIIGNTETYSNIPMWQKVIALLRAKGSVGTSLALCCPRHTDKIISGDAEVDMLEFKPYSEVDLDESPIVVLGCGHFFTAETLDGLVGLQDVYEVDSRTGSVSGLKDLIGQLSLKIPSCPHCRSPIRQYVTQRYNRLINRAVIDEMSKRFIVMGQTELQDLNSQLQQIEDNFEESSGTIIEYDQNTSTSHGAARYGQEMTQRLRKRYSGAPFKLLSSITNFQKQVNERHEPAHKLHVTTMSFMRHQQESARTSSALLDTTPHAADHQRITYGARMMEIKAIATILEDKFRVLSATKSKCTNVIPSLSFYGGSPVSKTKPFLDCCTTFIADCETYNLPKLAVETTLYYARIARQYQASRLASNEDREKATEYRDTAKMLLEKAQDLCSRQFKGADALLEAVRESLTFLQDRWYEEVTAEEIAAIKKAMVSGPGGIATHSGHWYDCVNGHTNPQFAIGECGMPMQRARCPECGEPIGGQNHQAVAGVTRARNMEG
ncbi:hypothetical protein N0V90_006726 [Kalmusia sp. IMI 367209]|nr:hypothetical protein N0V90_006726 [Kalmusia sp. IMI 367209]